MGRVCAHAAIIADAPDCRIIAGPRLGSESITTGKEAGEQDRQMELPLGQIVQGESAEVMSGWPDGCVDVLITDGPYGLHFMGKTWDRFGVASNRGHRNNGDKPDAMIVGKYDHRRNGEYQEAMQVVFAEGLRVVKPGGYCLAFGGPRTFHRLTCAIEDAGWEIRDVICWLFGQGYPKSLNISKAIDKAMRRQYVDAAIALGLSIPGNSYHDWTKGEHSPSDAWWERFKAYLKPEQWETVEREVVAKGYRVRRDSAVNIAGLSAGEYEITTSVNSEAQQWEGWGTALKPGWEPIIVARKPFKGTVAGNVLEHGTGALNIDGCRIGTSKEVPKSVSIGKEGYQGDFSGAGKADCSGFDANIGRWPANVVHDGSEEVMEAFDHAGERRGATSNSRGHTGAFDFGTAERQPGLNDNGSAARFFYCAKTSRTDRNEGLEGFGEKLSGMRNTVGRHLTQGNGGGPAKARNNHPTVKPTDLMRWLCRLVTPPGGIVLDPFVGSGSTGKAAILEGFQFVGIEREAEYCEIARARLAHAEQTREAESLGRTVEEHQGHEKHGQGELFKG